MSDEVVDILTEMEEFSVKVKLQRVSNSSLCLFLQKIINYLHSLWTNPGDLCMDKSGIT
jgi:hypothetical protein